MENNNNRRSNYRLLRRPEHSWQLNIEDHLITKNIVDISATGLAFKAPASFKLGVGQTLNMAISLKPGENFECQGRILWSKSVNQAKHTMNLFGVKFERLPAWVDTHIVQELHKDVLKAKWEWPDKIENGDFQLPHLPDNGWAKLARQLMVAFLIAAFFAAAHFYQRNHLDQSIENRFNKGLAKKIGHI